MAAEPTLAAGTLIAGRYRVLRPAGAGGMGVVYVVEHINTGGRAALKIMRGDHAGTRAVERFRREARASAVIQSDHVVRVTDADVAADLGDAPFLVMELLDGEDLAQLLTRRPILDARETVDILGQVARGLDRAHAAGITHRDLKPQNIFLHRREDGTTVVKLVDFGISKIHAPAGPRGEEVTGLTRAEDLVGTPQWMSPEQAMSMHHAIGPATDVWAIGLLAFCMLSGDSYWGERPIIQILGLLAAPSLAAPSTIDKRLTSEFDRWFAKSCAREPERRYSSVIRQVEQLALALGVQSPRFASMHAIDEEVTDVMSGDASTPAKAALVEPTPATLNPARLTPLTAALLAGVADERTLPPDVALAQTATDPMPRPVVERANLMALDPASPQPVSPPTPRFSEASMSVSLPLHFKLNAPPRQLLWLAPIAVAAVLVGTGFVVLLRSDRPTPPPAPSAAVTIAPPVAVSAPVPTPSASEMPVTLEVDEPAPATRTPRAKKTPKTRQDAFDTQK